MKETFRQIFQDDYPGTQTVVEQIIRPIFKDDFRLLPIPENIPLDKNARDANIVSIKRIGHIEGNGVRNVIEFFDVTVSDNSQLSRSRVNIQACIRSTLFIYTQAFMVFHYKNPDGRSWRFSYARKQSSNRESTDAKRYTYLFGSQFQCRTASERFEKLRSNPLNDEAILDAFSVETLNKEFFDKYKAQYTKFVGHIGDTKPNRDYVKKLLGRLVFLQFLQRKGWMGVPAEIEGWDGGDKSYLTKLIIKNADNDRLLSDVLEPLFFDTLNKEREGHIADAKLCIDDKQIKIPYLNGGLFDKDNADREDIDFPYSFFKGLIEFFDSYNFTIDENDPDDSEVGIDPEMLGHIFENLLEDNKDKGAFYTPKEIVQYMCRESVIQYLKTKQPDERYAEAIEHLIRDGKVDEIIQNKPTARQFSEWLKNVKVCDPAIGSGAFPMGVLNVLYRSRQLLYGFTQNNAEFLPAKVKCQIIQDNIYGVDIEQGAVDIARLRFWLSLVVDENKPKPLPNLDYKIMCGNSLLSRYAFDVPLDDVFVEYNKTHRDNPLSLARYKEKVAEYTNISDHTEKADFQQTIKEVKEAFKTKLDAPALNRRKRLEAEIQRLVSGDLFDGGKRDVELIEKKRKKLQKMLDAELAIANNQLYANAFEWRFEFPQLLDDNGNFIGFDIVIANPPYIDSETMEKIMPEMRQLYKKRFQTTNGNWDIYIPFYELGIHLSSRNGIISYITPNKWLSIGYGSALREFCYKNIFSINDCRNIKVFEAGNEPIICIICKDRTIEKIQVNRFNEKYISNTLQEIEKKTINISELGAILSDNIDILLKIRQAPAIVSDYIIAENPFSTAEAYELIGIIDDNHNCVDSYKLVNTGTIDPYINLWGVTKTAYLKHKYLYPSISKQAFLNKFPRRVRQANSPKIIISGMRYFECYFDEKGEYIAGKSTIILLEPKEERFFKLLLAILNSKLISFYIKQSFSTLGIGGGINFTKDMVANLPIPKICNIDNSQLIIKHVNKIIDNEVEVMHHIDKCIYRLYHLTYDEVKIIDPATPITREEYEE